jgi:hypothetical protein
MEGLDYWQVEDSTLDLKNLVDYMGRRLSISLMSAEFNEDNFLDKERMWERVDQEARETHEVCITASAP